MYLLCVIGPEWSTLTSATEATTAARAAILLVFV
jgi:hypothetical protein